MNETSKPPAPRATPEQLKRDEARISAEIAGTDGGIDPFPAAVRATRMPMVITNPRLPDNPIVFANDSFCRLTGYNRDEIVGHNCRFLQGLETDPDAVARLREAIAAPRAIEIDLRNYRKDGTPFWNRLLMAPVNDASGQLAYFFASQLDVTLERERLAALEGENAALTAERLINQERLEFSEQSLRLATEAAEIGTWDFDLFTDTLTWSDRTKAMFGIAPNVPGDMADFYAGLHPDDREATVAAFAAALDPLQRTTYDVEYRTIGKEDGVVRWVAAKGRGLFDEMGRCVRAMGTAIDITARKEADERLRRSETELRELNATLEAQVAERTAERDRMWRLSTDVMLVAHFDGTIEAVNPAWTRLFDWTPAELKGRSFIDFVYPDDVEATTEEASRLSQGHTTLTFVNRYRHRDGSYRWLSWTAVPEDRFIHAVGRDITAERETAEALAQSENALRQSQKMEAVGQLTGGLAHDFNNLLAGISGSLELMQTRMQQGRFNDVERYMAAAQGASKRAAALTHRLLAFSRRQTLDPKPTNVNRLVADIQELIQRTVGPTIPIEVVGTSGIWPALVDPSQLENALLNLCINARDAMPDGGRITIETANKWIDAQAARQHDMPEGQYLSLSVTDTGTGMPPEVIARVFEPFFTTKPLGQGTGLGLSMIYGFAQQSGGQVRIYSEVGKGTTVCIYLPRHYGEVEDDHGSRDATVLPRSDQGETVLIVDDEPTVRMLIADILEDLGYTAIEAGDSAAGLKVLQSDVRIDLLVTDVGLPGGMNGRQMADAGRVVRPALKVLFITGYAENAAVGNGYLAPGMAVLTKPFAIETMAARIRSMIEASLA